MRTNLRDSVKPEMLAPGTKARIIARNTFQFTAPNGDKVTRLHNTDVVRKTAKGKTVLNSAGWKTVTTKDRMNSQLKGYRIISEKGVWYVDHVINWHTWDKANRRVAFYDGIVIPDCFKHPAKAAASEKRELTLRSKVKAFVAKLDKMECLPDPSPGDCWLCSMRDANGKTMGEHGNDAGHIREHIKEGYLHGSLIFNALQSAGYRNPAFIFQMEQADRKAGRKPSNVKRALKKYLYRQLELVA